MLQPLRCTASLYLRSLKTESLRSDKISKTTPQVPGVAMTISPVVFWTHYSQSNWMKKIYFEYYIIIRMQHQLVSKFLISEFNQITAVSCSSLGLHSQSRLKKANHTNPKKKLSGYNAPTYSTICLHLLVLSLLLPRCRLSALNKALHRPLCNIYSLSVAPILRP